MANRYSNVLTLRTHRHSPLRRGKSQRSSGAVWGRGLPGLNPYRLAAAQSLLDRLIALRARCQRQASSIVTPLGDEMYYRYQQFLIDDATDTLAALLQSSSSDKGASRRPVSRLE